MLGFERERNELVKTNLVLFAVLYFHDIIIHNANSRYNMVERNIFFVFLASYDDFTSI